jgi:hypothetical protein
MESWRQLEQSGFEVRVFDENCAREFIRTNLGSRYEKAFEKCYHPSMKSDYEREQDIQGSRAGLSAS